MHITVAKYTWGFSEKLEINSLLRKLTHRWRDNIKSERNKMTGHGLDLVQVGCGECNSEPLHSRKRWAFCNWLITC
jgi:predicted N-acyltransferase